MRQSEPEASRKQRVPYLGLIIPGALAVLALAILLPRAPHKTLNHLTPTNSTREAAPSPAGGAARASRASDAERSFMPRANAREIVSAKLHQFVEGRRKILQAMAARFKVEIAPDVEQFFRAAETGNWEDLKNRFAALSDRRTSSGTNEDLKELWGPILETYGVAEVVHNWPPDKLLNHGESVLAALRPGMIYAGGTDAGRFIPTLLNETSGGERHMILTQNALADNTYVQYLNFLYGDRLAPLTPEDSQKAFSDYLADAQRRLADKQLRPGEDVRVTDNRVQVSGQVAVMAINEMLFKKIMEKNPGMSFAMEESFPFDSLYSDAAPLGPILELHAGDAGTDFPERAAQAVSYWRDETAQLASDAELPAQSEARKAIAKMAAAQAGLLANHNARDQAAEIFGYAVEICPSSPEAVFRYVNLLLTQNSHDTALSVAEKALAAAPDNTQFKDLAERLRTWAHQRQR